MFVFLHNWLVMLTHSVSRLFDLFTSILDVVLQNARREGQLDSGIVDIKAKHVEMKEPPKVMLLSIIFLELLLPSVITYNNSCLGADRSY